MEATWQQIARRGEHIVDPLAYEVLYGAPSLQADPVAWRAWMDEANRRVPSLPRIPLEFHTDDCPGCWADQWKETP